MVEILLGCLDLRILVVLRCCLFALGLWSRNAGGRNCRRDLGLDLVEWQHLQFPFRGRRVRRNRHILFDRRKARHLDFNCPRSICQLRKRIEALSIGDGAQFLAALSGRYHCSRNRQAAEGDLSLVFRGGCQVGDTQPPHGAEKTETAFDLPPSNTPPAPNFPRAFPHDR